jgi:hypothetical protein
MEIIRKEEMEAMKIEEITSGGFIPPQADVEAASFDVAPERYASASVSHSFSVSRFPANSTVVVYRNSTNSVPFICRRVCILKR